MSWFSRYIRSSVGMKHLMALSGLLLALFVLQHMLAHLQVFISYDQYNAYAKGFQDLGALLWVARIGLLVIFLVHVFTAVRLVMINRAARPVRYRRFKPVATRFYERAMALTGLALLAFVIYHLLHFTTGDIMPENFALQDPKGRHDVARMMVAGFQNVGVSVAYIVAMALLCAHLAHGMSSWFQSLGMNHPKYNPIIRKVGPIYGVVTFLGYISIPIAVLAGGLTL